MRIIRRALVTEGAGALGTALLARHAFAVNGTAGAADPGSRMFETLRARRPRIVKGEDPQARCKTWQLREDRA
jgi:hypothetical protein